MARLLVKRGAIEASDCAEMDCRANASGKGSSVAATIMWVIDDGVTVKKGDKLMDLDASALRERLREQASRVAEARTARDQAVVQHKLVRKGGKVEVRLAEVQVTLTELGLKKYRGTDPDEKPRLQLLVERGHGNT